MAMTSGDITHHAPVTFSGDKSFIFWTIAARLSQNEAAKPWSNQQKSPARPGLDRGETEAQNV